MIVETYLFKVLNSFISKTVIFSLRASSIKLPLVVNKRTKLLVICTRDIDMTIFLLESLQS